MKIGIKWALGMAIVCSVPAWLLGALAAVAAENSGRTRIVLDGTEPDSIRDLRDVLAGYDVGEIRFEKVPLESRTGQAFFVQRHGRQTLVRYTTQNSFENAVYTLLDRWGFRWYGPGEHWLVKPQSIPGDDIVGTWIEPSFRNRSFFGTGGLDVTPPNDPENRYKAGWLAWKRRNRFNSDYAATGHTGEVFYRENEELLDRHPEWFNGDAGKRAGRIRIEVPEAVAAYKTWALRKRAGAKDPFVVIGVDPEDGRGGPDDPLPPDGFAGLDHWNHADKWWWLANRVADACADELRVAVSMYAYGDGPNNVLVPRFPLRKNVYPVIIPYAFQTAYLPAEMVTTWAKQVDGTMGLYDYWNITQWSQGLPQFELFEMPKKLLFWRENKVDGVYIETTDAAGPMGHAWWLAGQLLFDPSQDLDALYQRYLRDCFGDAGLAMKRMYDRWALNYQGAGEVSLSLADLSTADNLVQRGSPQWHRVNDLKAYVHFMKLHYDHDDTQASKDRLFEYLYAIHHLCLVQTSAFIGQQYVRPLDKGNVVPKTVVKPLTPDEIDAQFRRDLLSDPKRYNVLDFRFDPAKAKFTRPMNATAWRFGSRPVAYFVSPRTETISVDAGNEQRDVPFTVSSGTAVLIRDQVGLTHFDYTESFDGRTWHMKRFKLNVEAGKTYSVALGGGYNRFKTDAPVVMFNTRREDDFDNYAYPTQFLYIPKDCTEIIFENTAGSPGTFYLPGEPPPKESRATPVGIKDLCRQQVNPGWRGKVIAAQFAHSSWRLKNLPNVLALQPFEYKE